MITSEDRAFITAVISLLIAIISSMVLLILSQLELISLTIVGSFMPLWIWIAIAGGVLLVFLIIVLAES